jgi:uncharacterized protein YndB with AHSA1/START domain
MNDSLSMERDYPVSPERLFEAWTNVELVRTWFGCGPGMLWDVLEWDARSGGKLHVRLDFPDGPYEVRGEFRIVERPKHLRYLWAEGDVVDVTIEAQGSGSRLRVEHTWRAHEDGKTIRSGGWTSAFENLARLSASATSPAWP